MLNPLLQIGTYILESFVHIWPYLLVTIPLAVLVKMSGVSRYINRAFTARPIIAIILATAVGAFSPLCSCSVIPVIAALLIGGVPLAPVMSFWLASPSMDPEIFFLTVSSLGWELAVWRLGATLVLSLAGGLITHLLVIRGWLGANILRDTRSTRIVTYRDFFEKIWANLKARLNTLPQATSLFAVAGETLSFSPQPVALPPGAACGCGTSQVPATQELARIPTTPLPAKANPTFARRLASETWSATTMVIKFMLFAWLIGALIHLYVPETWITNLLGGDKPWAIVTAALLGVPVYTSNLAAMPLIGGLLAQGMHPAAALAFLIAGPTTTLPAMSAVWGLVNRKVFSLYIGFTLIAAILLGYLYSFYL